MGRSRQRHRRRTFGSEGRGHLHRPALTVSRGRPSRPLTSGDLFGVEARKALDPSTLEGEAVRHRCDSWDRWDVPGYRLRVVRRLALAPVLALVASLLASQPARPGRGRRRRHERRATSSIANTSWSTGADWRSGQLKGVRVKAGSLVPKKPRAGKLGGRSYQVGTWTSPWSAPGFGLTQLIPTWEAVTEGDSVVKVQVRGQAADGTVSSWDSMAEWTLDNPSRAAPLARQPDRRPGPGQRRHLAGRDPADPVAGAGAPLPQLGHQAARAARPGRRDGQCPGRPRQHPDVDPRPGGRDRARRTDLLPDDALRPLPPVGRRRRGLVLADVAPRWCWPTTASSPAPSPTSRPATPTPRSTTPRASSTTTPTTAPATGPFNTAYASTLTTGDAYVTRLPDLRAAERLHRGRRAAGRVGRLRPQPADRRADLGQQRAPDGDRRVRGRRRRRRQRPAGAEQQRRTPRL